MSAAKMSARAPMEGPAYVVWNKQTLPSRGGKNMVVPYVTVSPSNGRIAFNHLAVQALGLGDKMGVEFIQSTGKEDEWYVAPAMHHLALPVRAVKGGVCINSIPLAVALAESLKRKSKDSTFRVQLATKPTPLEYESGSTSAFALITLNVTDVTRKGGGR